jgi:PAS domain S-box-containing protein
MQRPSADPVAPYQQAFLRGAVLFLALVVSLLSLFELAGWTQRSDPSASPGRWLSWTALAMLFAGLSLLPLVFTVKHGHALVIALLIPPLIIACLALLTNGFMLARADLNGMLGGLVSPLSWKTYSISMPQSMASALLFFCAIKLYVAIADHEQGSATMLATGAMIVGGLGLSSLLTPGRSAVSGPLPGIYSGMDFLNAVGVCVLALALAVRSRQTSAGVPLTARLVFSTLLCMGGLVLDLSTPPWIGSNVIYVPVILSTLWFGNPKMAFHFAFLCSLFSLLAFIGEIGTRDQVLQPLISRLLGVVTLWTVALLIHHFKKATVQLERGRMRFEALLNNSPETLVTIDGSGIIQEFNRAAEKMFGYTYQDVAGRNVSLLMPEPYHSAHDQYLDHYHETGEKRIIGTIREVMAKRKDGTIFPIDLSISVLTDGRDGEFVGIIRDLTGRREQEEVLRSTVRELALYTTELERSNLELDEFAYIASHDLKEPLRGLHNHSRFLLEDYDALLDADGKRRLHRLLYLTQRMEKLVNDLLYFSRLGRQDLAVKPTDLNLVIRDVTRTLEQFLDERHAHVHVIGALPTILCDTIRITEVYRNLIVNGVKYNNMEERNIDVGFLAEHIDDGGKMMSNVLFVRDNGKGIAADFHQDIFRIFKRLEAQSSEDDGTGVGLTFVKKIIARHRGKIWLESEPGSGTTFYFTLEAG